ncbi:hypothetical protein ACJMK2_018133 [Sinanodonta woodiana]|uniref:Death domain-containing protein n=1 Tax=Sinanodonta woodiana TaxID=1069815 RepID=A0ABD3UE49_SINWO
MQIMFTANENDNNLTFGVEIVGEATSAELEFWLKGTQVYVCRFNTKELLTKESEATPSMLTDDSNDLAIFIKSKTLTTKSLAVLAFHIPVEKVFFLALGLGLSTNEVEHLKNAGHKDNVLAVYVLIEWRSKHIKDDFDDMISELAEALDGIGRTDLASALKNASQTKRLLNQRDFHE